MKLNQECLRDVIRAIKARQGEKLYCDGLYQKELVEELNDKYSSGDIIYSIKQGLDAGFIYARRVGLSRWIEGVSPNGHRFLNGARLGECLETNLENMML